ncbi:MAG: nuclear transport factor 2 family protein [Silvibacterium sp.]
MQRSPAKIAALTFPFDSARECGLLSGTHMRRSTHASQPSQRTMACLMLAAALCLVLANPAWAMPRHESHAVHKEIEALEMEWRNAEVSNNVSEMDRLLADDYIGISANGTVETKAQALAQRKAGTVRIQNLNMNDLKIRVYGDTAVVTSQATLVGSNGQSDISGNYRYTRVYNKRLGKWKIVSFEASRMNDADARAKQ